jgi:hypothetical protein
MMFNIQEPSCLDRYPTSINDEEDNQEYDEDEFDEGDQLTHSQQPSIIHKPLEEK